MKHSWMTLIAVGVALLSGLAQTADTATGSAPIRAALQYVLSNNARFTGQHDAAYFSRFVAGQQPLVTLVSCSDSRVHTHVLDPTPDNDIFVIRNIGNQFATAQGSVEYGVHHLHTPLLLIVGHSACGAVTAALGDYSGESPAIRRELDNIHVDAERGLVHEVVSNVHNQIEAALQRFRAEVDAGTLGIVGAVYDFRGDYGQGQGQLIVVNVNGERDAAAFRQSPLVQGMQDLVTMESAQ